MVSEEHPGRGAARAASLHTRLRGPWRVAVAEASMAPAIESGDWLLVDPTTRRWLVVRAEDLPRRQRREPDQRRRDNNAIAQGAFRFEQHIHNLHPGPVPVLLRTQEA